MNSKQHRIINCQKHGQNFWDGVLAAINLLARKLSVIESSDQICVRFGKLKADLEKQGMIIDDADLFIAASALTIGSTLVTNNTRHFKRVKELQLQNWSQYAAEI